VILAGGLGTRLRPITEKIPKCLAPVGDRPFLCYLLEMLRDRGVRDVVLCTGYLGEQVEDCFGDGRSLGLNIQYSREKERLLGTGGALKLAENLLAESFLVVNGDTYLDIDYKDVYAQFAARRLPALIAANPVDESERSDLAISPDLTVLRYDKYARGLGYVNAGVLVLRRDIISAVSSGHPVSLENEVFPELIKRCEMSAYISSEKFYDIGTFASLKGFETCLQGGVH